MVRDGYSILRIMEEIKMCIVLCGNCHRELHHQEIKQYGNPMGKVQTRRKWLIKLKTKLRCFKCGRDGYNLLDFHHLRPKKYGINYMASRFSIKSIKSELLKCVPLCVNCHRKIHADLIHIRISDRELELYWNKRLIVI